MPAPLSRQFVPITTPEAALQRRKDDHYHLEMIAQDSAQVVDYHSQCLRLQYDAAVSNLRGMSEISTRQDQTNSLLGSLVSGMDRLNESFEELSATANETVDAVYAQTEVLRDGFQQLARVMMEQQRVLESVADVLRRPYETRVQELLNEADRALKQGMRSAGRDQRSEFTDALRDRESTTYFFRGDF